MYERQSAVLIIFRQKHFARGENAIYSGKRSYAIKAGARARGMTLTNFYVFYRTKVIRCRVKY